MIKAVIFDCFGVLTTDGLTPFRKKYFGHDPALAQEASDWRKRTDAGLATYNDLVTQLASMAGVSEPETRRQIENNVPDTQLFDYIANQLKPRFKIGMLSNAGDNRLNEIFSKEQVALFDAIVLSYEIGAIKPDPRAYHMIAERLGVKPDECIFIDDQERYCTAARDTGMQAILYQNFYHLRNSLDTLLESRAIPLRNQSGLRGW